MRIEVLMFAAARESAGCESIHVDVSETPSAAEVIDAIGQRLPALSPLLASCRLAVDCSYVSGDTLISDESEVALIPPVSGG